MKQKKRMISRILLFVMITASIVGSFCQKVEASESVLTYDQYKADYYMDYSIYEYMMSDNFTLPYRGVVEKNSSSTTYQVLITAWELATFELSDVTEYSKKRIGYYETFLFDILYTGYEPTNVTETLDGIVKGTQASMLKKVSEALKDGYNKHYLEMPIGDMDEETWTSFQQALEGCEEIKDVMGAIGNIGKVLQYASNVEELLYKLAKIQLISQIANENAVILEQIAASTSDLELQVACEEMVAICRNQLTETEIIALMSGDMVATELTKWVFDELWEGVVLNATGYGLSIQAGQAVGKWAAGLLFSTDEQVETYYEMCALYKFEDELRKAVVSYEQAYRSSRTTENAKLYNAAFEMLLRTSILGCDISVEHARLNYDSGAVNLFVSYINGNHEKYEQYKTSLENIKKELELTLSFAQNDMYNLYRELYCQEFADDIDMPVVENNGIDDIETLLVDLQSDIFLTCDVVITDDMTLSQDLETYGDLYLESGTLDLNGHTLKVAGSLYQTGGTINVNTGTLEVTGDYRMQGIETDLEGETSFTTASYAGLVMQRKADKVKIGGSFYNQSGNATYNNVFTAGTMEVGGDFYQLNGHKNNFQASGTHKVILNGTDKQTVCFDSSGSSYFNDLELVNQNVEFTSNICGWTLQRDTVFGNGLPNGMTGTFDLNGYTLKIDGDLIQIGGTIDVNTGTLEVAGDYRMQGIETDLEGETSYVNAYAGLVMQREADKVKIGGSFYNQSGNATHYHYNVFTAGTMEVGGDFYQLNGHKNNFQASGTHKVILNGTDKQTVCFDSSGSSCFNDLELVNQNVEFTSSICGWTLQRDTVFGNGLPNGMTGTFDLNGYTLKIDGDLIQIGGTIDVNTGTLEVTGNYRMQGIETDLEGETSFTTASYAALVMQREADRVKIGGSFYNQSGNATYYNVFTAGTMEVGGDFYQLNGHKNNFQASGTHKVILNGTDKQTVCFDSSGSSCFNDLELVNQNVEFTSNICGWTLQRDTVFGNGLPNGMTGTFDLNGHTLKIDGDLIQIGGTIDVNTGTLEVAGDYRMQGIETDLEGKTSYVDAHTALVMKREADKVKIGGSFYNQTGGAVSYNVFTAGTMEVGGDFYQLYGLKNNFAASGTHKVILNGTDKQNVHFDSTSSHFNILQLTKDKDTGYTFSPDNCWNELILSSISIEQAVVTLSKDSYIYDGTEKKPTIKSVVLEGVTLKEGTDYTIAYTNNIQAGVASVIITGIGDYSGTATKDFEIVKGVGLCKADDGKWYYYKDGVVDTTYTGMAKNTYGWWYVKNGSLDQTYTGMAKNDHGWWYMKKGKLDQTYNGMAKNDHGWWYMKKGKLDQTYTGLATNEYGTWYMKKGKLDKTANGMVKVSSGWVYLKNGKLDTTYTGMAKNKYGWWYIKNGELDQSYTGMAKNQYGWWYMTKGKLDTNYTGMAKNQYGWWYMKKGKLDTTFEGIAQNEWGKWYMKGGKLQSNYNGTKSFDGVTYTISKGKVVSEK